LFRPTKQPTAGFARVQDGTQVQFKSALRKTYITADQGGGGAVLANRTQASDWETFKVSRVAD
jgi:hypothetical protein